MQSLNWRSLLVLIWAACLLLAVGRSHAAHRETNTPSAATSGAIAAATSAAARPTPTR